MGITDRLKFIARSYMNQVSKKGHKLFDQAGLTSLNDNEDESLEEQVRLAVEAEIRTEEKREKQQQNLGNKYKRNEKNRKQGYSSSDKSKNHRGNRSKNYQNKDRKILQHYANLELIPGATAEEVHKAWRKLILKYHPDRYVGDKNKIKRATKITQIINSSYTALLEHLEP